MDGNKLLEPNKEEGMSGRLHFWPMGLFIMGVALVCYNKELSGMVKLRKIYSNQTSVSQTEYVDCCRADNM